MPQFICEARSANDLLRSDCFWIAGRVAIRHKKTVTILFALVLLFLNICLAQEPKLLHGPEEVAISSHHLTKRPVSPMQQGQFIEILCNLIPSITAQQVVSTSFEASPPCRVAYKGDADQIPRPWYPDGAVQVTQYSLDTDHPFNGARSQKIEIPIEHARAGISQDGFYLKKGVAYTLRLHMRSDRPLRVNASLHGGGGLVAGPVSLGQSGTEWNAAEAQLLAECTLNDATLTIDFEGPGTLWLDRIYLIGSDAVLGIWRPDVVAALSAMHPAVIRFGGSTIEDYDWQSSIGPWDQRQPFTTIWGGLEENFVGIDEFIQLCRLINAEPLLCVRWTGMKPADAAAEVEYCNGSAATHWGALRAKNGHPEPYGVRYWQIGNEVGNPDYDNTVAAFAAAMKNVDPNIKLISSFPTPELLAAAGSSFNYLAPHHYEIDDLVKEQQDLARLADWIAHSGGDKDIRVAVTEWNTTGGDFGLHRGMLQTLGNALSVSRYLNLLQRYADLVEIANRSNLSDSFGSGFLETGPGWIYKTPAYYAQQMYAQAAGSYPVMIRRSTLEAWPLQVPDLSATLSADSKTLRIYAVNSSPQAKSIRFHLEDVSGEVSGGFVEMLDDREHSLTTEVMNSRDDPNRVSSHRQPLSGLGKTFDFTFQPFALTELDLKLSH